MTTYEIHPAIGVARVGSSQMSGEDGSFLGPEPGVPPPARYRDPAGALKRQAARFRIFACHRDKDGTLLDATELSLATASRITWTVQLANRKGVARRQYGTKPGFRNRATGRDDADRSLIIDPGPRSVSSPGECRLFDTGMFRTTRVRLGEITMEQSGRLRVLGGHGRAGSDPAQPRLDLETGHFADNDHWYDDISDGPVTVTVELGDGTVATSTAWVIAGPPDFAPGIMNLVTLYDLLFDYGVKRGLLKGPADDPSDVSFVRHVKPILDRTLGYRWVNRAAAFGYDNRGTGHGPGGAGDFSRHWPALADPSPASEALRASLASRLRNPDRRGASPRDESTRARATTVRPRVVRLRPRQRAPADAHAVPDHAGLGPWRVRERPGQTRRDHGAAARRDHAGRARGMRGSAALSGNRSERHHHELPRAVPRGRAVPDFSCRREAGRGDPIQLCSVAGRFSLLPLGGVARARFEEARLVARAAAGRRLPRPGAAEMVPWARGLGPDYQEMIDHWDRLGLVVDRGPAGDPSFVEDERDADALGP